MREVHQVADESPRARQRKISPFRFVHPCTSRDLHGRVSARLAKRPMARRRPGLGRFRPGRTSGEAYRKSSSGEGEACKNATRTGLGSIAVADASSLARSHPASRHRGQGMDFPDRVAYAIIVGASTTKGFDA